MNSHDLLDLLLRDGWKIVGQKGSHVQLKHPDKAGRVTLPHPKRDVPLGTQRSIFRQAGWDWARARRH